MNRRTRQSLKLRPAPGTRPAVVPAPHSLAEMLEPRILLSAALSWVPGPSHLAVAPDHAIWYSTAGTLTRRDADGSISLYTLASTPGGPAPEVTSDLVFTVGNTPWFVTTDVQGSRIQHLTADGQFVSVTNTPARIWDLAPGADGRLWFIEGNNRLGSLDLDSNTPVYRSIPSAWGFSDLATAPDGTVWMAGDRSSGGFVATVTASGQLATFNLDAPPSDIALGANGTLYVGGNNGIWRVSTSGSILKISLPGVTALDLDAVADGSLWFIDNRNPLNPISRLSPDGTLQQYALNNVAGAKITSLIIADDGVPWFTGVTTNNSGTIDLVGSLGTADLLGQARQFYPTYRQSFTGTVASFQDPLASASAAGYLATIDWGDGTSSNGSVVANASGGFDVQGTHSYNVFDWRVVKVSIVQDQRALTVSSVAYIPPPPADQSQVSLSVQANVPFSGVVARYVGLDSSAASSYRVTIRWGDGASSTAQLVPGDNGDLLVYGTHTYAHTGTFSVSTALKDASATLPAYWGNPTAALRIYRTYTSGVGILVGSAMSLNASTPFTPLAVITAATSLQLIGRTVTGTAGSFSIPVDDGSSTDARVSFTVLIDWGDGQVAQGVLQPTGSGTFNVTGSHTYAVNGDYPVSLIVRRTLRDLPTLQTEMVNDFAFRQTGRWAPAGSVVSSIALSSTNGLAAFTTAYPYTSTQVNVPDFSNNNSVSASEYQKRVGGIRISNGTDNDGGTQQPPTAPPPPAAPVVITPAPGATLPAAAPVAAPTTRPALTSATVRKVTTFTTVQGHSYTYAVPPAGSMGDPGQFNGEFGVVEGPPPPATDELPRDGSEHYDGSRTSRQPSHNSDSFAGAGSAASPTAAAAPHSAQEEPAASIPISAAAEPEVRMVSDYGQAEQNVATASVSGELLAAAELPSPAPQGTVQRWWKVAAILSTGAALQAWHWRRLLKARSRRHP